MFFEYLITIIISDFIYLKFKTHFLIEAKLFFGLVHKELFDQDLLRTKLLYYLSLVSENLNEILIANEFYQKTIENAIKFMPDNKNFHIDLFLRYSKFAAKHSHIDNCIKYLEMSERIITETNNEKKKIKYLQQSALHYAHILI